MITELPTWEECEEAIRTGEATALQRFIFNNEPAMFADALFRVQLLRALQEVQDGK